MLSENKKPTKDLVGVSFISSLKILYALLWGFYCGGKILIFYP